MLTSCVIDLQHGDWPANLAATRQDGVLAVLIKCTEGMDFADPHYRDFHDQAKRVGLLAGAFHFASSDDVLSQMNWFFAHSGVDGCGLPSPRLMLDFERGSKRGTMTLDGCREAVQVCLDATGKAPILYGGEYLRECLGGKRDPLLARCPLAWAEYGPVPHWPTETWPMWTLWQYTGDGVGHGKTRFRGIDGTADAYHFAGDESQLAAMFGAWKTLNQEASVNV